ncbi:hypothetical protein [Roseivivax sediminis]|uniref:Uncharacterized protein n=1 Tax=Roseivivax sediminis TaxID=936889 RepID=A0A1I1TWS7_9RHOB|nr:hypothetical protein [Roseivivax sediminis]SFD62954.1 hypothetical protein SAMN04515678_10213 [Roseivivax sediminis]
MLRSMNIAAALALVLVGGTATANTYEDPTWPCVQRKVESLSQGLMWPPSEEPTPELDEALEAAVDDLAAVLSLRRVSLEEAETRVSEFVAEHGANRAVLSEVFTRVFEELSGRRGQIIDGIADFSLGQIELSKKIDAARSEMDEAMQAEDPDFDRVDALEEQIDWDERIYTDRQRSLRYVCETPVLLEQRLYSLSQILQRAAQG